jgi:hypothetical protein
LKRYGKDLPLSDLSLRLTGRDWRGAFGVSGGFAYLPNVSNTDAWSWYAASGLGFDVPSRLLPADIGVSLTGGAGYSWFGNQSPELGGFPLPAYLNWQAGVTFTYKVFNFDLRYYDTNLSKGKPLRSDR